MERHDLTDEQWSAIRVYLPRERTGKRGRPWLPHRTVINGICWILAAGAPWRDLPERYGRWKSVYNRFYRWRKEGLWDRIFEGILKRMDRCEKIDRSLWCIDGSVVRAHRCAAGSKCNEPEEPENHALGRSKGGFSTKIHLLADAQGIPLAMVITAGQSNEAKSFENTMNQLPARFAKRPEALAGDKAYSSNKIRQWCKSRGITAVIPTRSNERRRRFQRAKYRKRSAVENTIGWLKEKRRIATRYEKQGLNYLAFLKIASTLLLLTWE